MAGALADFLVVREDALAILEILICEQESHLADQDLISSRQGCSLRNSAPVDEGAVATSHVLGVVLATRLIETNAEVFPRDQIVEQLQGQVLRPARRHWSAAPAARTPPSACPMSR